jgi:hypothetical protein
MMLNAVCSPGCYPAEWIESMNTVMDDNKMLTLASNERIPLTPTMRLLLEINHMNHCSPATVSRGGVIFVNAEDVGWKPAVDSWIEKLEVCWVCRLMLMQDAMAAVPGACEPGTWLECSTSLPAVCADLAMIYCTCRLRSTGPC